MPSLRADTTQTTPPQNGTPQLYRAEVAQHAALQLAEAARAMPSRQVEITLSPEELGRVRLGMAPQEAGIVVHVMAERPETIDLLRRHISALETAFAAIGYEDIHFDFAGSAGADSDTASDTPFGDPEAEAFASPSEALAQINLDAALSTGLDIRL